MSGFQSQLLGLTSVLSRIVERTSRDLEARREDVPLAILEARVRPTRRNFAEALRGRDGQPALIAEYKLRSPSQGDLRPGATPNDVIPIYADYASAISVLCDAPHFGGGFDKLAAARELCQLPLLCKDFVIDRYQIAEGRVAGADSVLLMASVLSDDQLVELLRYARQLGMEPLVETHDDDELQRALDIGATVIGVNSRDLRTLKIDFDRMLERLARVPERCVRVAESGVESRADVERLVGLADAVLIGTSLMRAPDIAAAIETLGWTPA